MARGLELLLSAVLLAGLYATMAYGLGLVYGVQRIVNLNHGGMIMVGAYLGWWFHLRAGIDPYLSLPIVAAISFVIGVFIYWLLVRRLPRGAAGGVQSLLLPCGVWLLLRNGAYLTFTGNDQVIRTEYSTRGLMVLGSALSLNRIIVFAIAMLTMGGLHLVLTQTY